LYKTEKIMEKYDLGLAFVCEYDLEFINLIEFSLQQEGISTFRVTTENISEVTERFTKKEISFNFYLDRASDVDDDFEELAVMLSRRHCIIFNPYNKISHAIDKANMHLEFITAGLNVPYSIIIPPHSEKEELYISMDDLAILGRPFIIKPCNTTGGGIGVVTGAESLKEIMEEYDVKLFKTSALNGSNVEELFEYVAELMYMQQDNKLEIDTNVDINLNMENRWTSCVPQLPRCNN